MSLLELERVCKRGQEGRRQRVLLDEVSMTVQASELAVVLGANRHECAGAATGRSRP